MGVIQNAINQTIGTAAIAARLAPGYEKRQELEGIRREMSGYKKQAATFDSDVGPKTEATLDLEDRLANQIVEKSERRFELRPTEVNYNKLKQNIHARNEFLAARRAEAMSTVADKQSEAQTQKADFKDYVKSLEIKGGGTVGDLPEWAQAHIMKTFEKKEEDK